MKFKHGNAETLTLAMYTFQDIWELLIQYRKLVRLRKGKAM